MYFRSYGLGKTWLDECVKRGPFEKQHGKHVQKLLKYKRQHLYHNLLISVRAIELQKVSVSDMKNLKSVC